ncbi:MAG: SRPBCC domain-containing protein [Caldilineaceae bacterium]|nr:SRPBCC domain-containing protein [Caldilineaceae bacterium]
MEPITIRKQIEIAAPPIQVWRYVGTAAGLCQWWGVEVIMEEQTGGHFEERGEHEGRPYRQRGEVITYDPPRQLVIRLHEAADRRWPFYAEISISLTGNESVTIVEVEHQAMTETVAVAQQTVSDNPSGPVMALPGYAGAVSVQSGPMSTQPHSHPSLTLQTLYSWRHWQEQIWQQRFGLLSDVVVSMQSDSMQPEAVS